MKTTVEVPDVLFHQAKQYAAKHGITLREVVELGLQRVLKEPREKQFRLKTITTKGEGMVGAEDWAEIRRKIYEGRGG
jgi:hypothetical protein